MHVTAVYVRTRAGQGRRKCCAASVTQGSLSTWQVPLVRDRKAPRGRMVQTEVWEWHGMGEDQGDEAASWLSEYLGRPVRLLRYAGEPMFCSPHARMTVGI